LPNIFFRCFLFGSCAFITSANSAEHEPESQSRIAHREVTCLRTGKRLLLPVFIIWSRVYQIIAVKNKETVFATLQPLNTPIRKTCEDHRLSLQRSSGSARALESAAASRQSGWVGPLQKGLPPRHVSAVKISAEKL